MPCACVCIHCGCSLLDNYEAGTGANEEVTSEEIKENRAFIDAILETKVGLGPGTGGWRCSYHAQLGCLCCPSQVMKKAHAYLVSLGKSPRDVMGFKRQLYDLWFKLYRRTRGSRALDSSGFEHVFVGETRGGQEVLGFHNWVQFYLQEKAGNVDYQGFIPGRKVGGATHWSGRGRGFTRDGCSEGPLALCSVAVIIASLNTSSPYSLSGTVRLALLL